MSEIDPLHHVVNGSEGADRTSKNQLKSFDLEKKDYQDLKESGKKREDLKDRLNCNYQWLNRSREEDCDKTVSLSHILKDMENELSDRQKVMQEVQEEIHCNDNLARKIKLKLRKAILKTPYNCLLGAIILLSLFLLLLIKYSDF